MKTMKTLVLTSMIAGAMLTAGSLHAATVLVDIQAPTTGSPAGGGSVTQAGWNGWTPSAGNPASFAYADATTGNLSATLAGTATAYERNYGLENVASGTLTNPNVWADQWFFSDATDGVLTLTLDNLKAGTYSFTSYHYADDLDEDIQGEPTASVFIGGIDTNKDVTFVMGIDTKFVDLAGNNSPSATLIEANGLFSTSFTVANDNDSIIISYQDWIASDEMDSGRLPTFGINGFVLIPEPSSLSLIGLLAGLTLRRRRRN